MGDSVIMLASTQETYKMIVSHHSADKLSEPHQALIIKFNQAIIIQEWWKTYTKTPNFFTGAEHSTDAAATDQTNGINLRAN
jgi:hypothetical protein